MEKTERIVSGYCRLLDQTRMIFCEYADGQLMQSDCAYPDCTFASSCPLAQNFLQP